MRGSSKNNASESSNVCWQALLIFLKFFPSSVLILFFNLVSKKNSHFFNKYIICVGWIGLWFLYASETSFYFIISLLYFFDACMGYIFLLCYMLCNFWLDVICCKFYLVGCWIFLYFYRCFWALNAIKLFEKSLIHLVLTFRDC